MRAPNARDGRMTVRWPPSALAALDAWRTRFGPSIPFPNALDLPPRPYPEAHDSDLSQRFCTDIPGGCPICDRSPNG